MWCPFSISFQDEGSFNTPGGCIGQSKTERDCTSFLQDESLGIIGDRCSYLSIVQVTLPQRARLMVTACKKLSFLRVF